MAPLFCILLLLFCIFAVALGLVYRLKVRNSHNNIMRTTLPCSNLVLVTFG